jgi:thioredoxin 1
VYAVPSNILFYFFIFFKETFMKNLSRYALLVTLALAASPLLLRAKAVKRTTTKEEKHAYTEVTSEEQFSAAVGTGKVVVVKFHAEWCGACKQMEPVFEKVAKSNSDVAFLAVNTDKVPDLARTFKVRSLPTTAIIKTKSGLLTEEELEQEVAQATGKAFGTKTTRVPAPAEEPAKAPTKAGAKKARAKQVAAAA